jgi:hypothetical protein
MADPQGPLFAKLRSIIGGYLVDVIREEGGMGLARLVREGLEAKGGPQPEDEKQLLGILRCLEEDQ